MEESNKSDTCDSKIVGSLVYDAIDNSYRSRFEKILLEDDIYKMNHNKRGKAIIFSHEYFEIEKFPKRSGTEVDVTNLKNTLPNIGFQEEDIIVYKDLRYLEITNVLKKVSKEDHSDNDLLMVFVLTHGGHNDNISAFDEEYPAENIWKYFSADQCPSLAGKPKIFFIIACRGSRVDGGVTQKFETENEVDAAVSNYSLKYSLPIWSDFVYVFSTFKGYYSFRNIYEGTWYIQALCNQISSNSNFGKTSFLDNLTAVNGRVAKLYAAGDMFGIKKQTPIIYSTLTKRLYFQNKKK